MKNATASSGRLYYLDWVRVLSMFGIFFFHNARFYDVFADWHVKNATTNTAASALVAFISFWIMPLFFLIAGAGTFYALKSRRAWQFVRERAMRLFIPLIFGMLVIVVPQAYFEAISHGMDLSQHNLLQVYGLYLASLPDLNWFHLWFLAYLFAFSLIILPLFISVKGGESIISRITARLNNPWLFIALSTALLSIINIFLYPDGFWGHRESGGWNIVAYLLFFITGYKIVSNQRLIESLNKLRWFTLSGAIISIISLLPLIDVLANPQAHYGTAGYALAHLIQGLSAWLWLFALLGLASRCLQKSNRFLTYANEAVLPFYVLHQTVIIVIGYYVVQWNAGVGAKYLTIATLSFISIMALYELLVRRVSALRFLFGMK